MQLARIQCELHRSAPVIQPNSIKPLVLVVDRDHSTLYTFQIALASHGYRTLAEQSAQGALNSLMQHSINAIVLDPHLFEMDGADLIRKIRHIQPLLPILIVSFDPIDDIPESVITRFLAKPPLPSSIRQAVDSLIEQSSCLH